MASTRKSAGSARAEKAASGWRPCLEAGASVERSGHGEEAAESEQIGEEDDIARKSQGAVAAPSGGEKPCRQRGGQGHDGTGAEQPSRGAAVNRALVQKLPQIEVGLPERRPLAPGEPGLGAGDDPDQQGR